MKPKKKINIEQKTGFSKLWALTEKGPIEMSVEILAVNKKYSAVASSNLQPDTKIIVEASKKRP